MKEGKMQIIRTIQPSRKNNPLNMRNVTRHFTERKNRIARSSLGIGSCVGGFLVNKGHENGLEEHYITSSGIIMVRNHRTHKAITVMVARKNQIKRYYDACGLVAPVNVLQVAEYNTKVEHWNY